MVKIQEEYINSICRLLEELVGNVKSKNLFTGYGLFHKSETMFAICLKNKLYVRADAQLADKLQKMTCKQLSDESAYRGSVNYYALSEEMLKDRDFLQKIVRESIQQVLKNQDERRLLRLKSR